MINKEQQEAKKVYEDLIKRDKDIVEKHGWITHYVFSTELNKTDTKTGVDIHTHGLKENFNHTDLQITLPVGAEVAHSVISTVVESIKNGKVYNDGDIEEGILQNNYKVRFQKVYESGGENRALLRIILPDKDGNIMASDLKDHFYDQCV